MTSPEVAGNRAKLKLMTDDELTRLYRVYTDQRGSLTFYEASFDRADITREIARRALRPSGE